MLYVHTLKTWNASNWMFRLLSRSMFIISFRFSALLMYFVITEKLCLSRRSSPRSCKTVNTFNTFQHNNNRTTLSRVEELSPSKTAVWWHSCQNAGASHTLWTPDKRVKSLWGTASSNKQSQDKLDNSLCRNCSPGNPHTLFCALWGDPETEKKIWYVR